MAQKVTPKPVRLYGQLGSGIASGSVGISPYVAQWSSNVSSPATYLSAASILSRANA